jgi:hypothetical protein
VKFYGHIDLNNNELQSAALEMEDNFPANPPVGRVIFRQQRVFIAADISGGNVAWVPLTNVINTHVHQQATAADTWIVNHNLNTGTPMVHVYDEGTQQMFIPDNVTIIDGDQLRITLGTPKSGRCVVMSGELTGNGAPAYSFIYEQTNAQTTWTVMHGLGYSPLVRIFVGNAEVQPLSVIHDSITQTTITFSSPTTGIARLI